MSDGKVWGTNTEIFRNDLCSVNLLHIERGGVCSFHKHVSKYNKFHVISGALEIRTECGSTLLHSGETAITRPGELHLFRGVSSAVVVEVMYVQYDPEDIDRKVPGYLEGYPDVEAD